MPTWTKKTPTKPGWYWHRNLHGSDIDRVLEVIYIRLYVNHLAISNSYITDTWPGGEWAGPLRQPREPKKGDTSPGPPGRFAGGTAARLGP